MKNLKFIYTGVVFLTMAACSESALDKPDMRGNIQLGATVGDLQINSRATADPLLTQQGDTLKAVVWLSDKMGEYGENPDSITNLPIRTKVEFKGSQLEYVYDDEEKNIQYPADDKLVYCIGLYPDSGWETSNDKIVEHGINGVEDLMFASRITGKWTNHFNLQRYEHLLTWIKINICATSHDAVDAWGTIEQITVNSDSNVTIDLETGKYSYGGDPQEIETITAGSDDIHLSTATHEVGSVFCSPEKGYTVTVTSKNKNNEEIEQTVKLNLNIINVDDDSIKEVSEEEDARGKCFVFSLYFTPHKVIEGVCTLNSWYNQNEDIYISAPEEGDISDESGDLGENGDSDESSNPNEKEDETIS